MFQPMVTAVIHYCSLSPNNLSYTTLRHLTQSTAGAKAIARWYVFVSNYALKSALSDGRVYRYTSF